GVVQTATEAVPSAPTQDVTAAAAEAGSVPAAPQPADGAPDRRVPVAAAVETASAGVAPSTSADPVRTVAAKVQPAVERTLATVPTAAPAARATAQRVAS